jgi:hypothetical protein
MFIGDTGDTGDNGKSQLLNLMKLAMGDFGEKVEVTLYVTMQMKQTQKK